MFHVVERRLRGPCRSRPSRRRRRCAARCDSAARRRWDRVACHVSVRSPRAHIGSSRIALVVGSEIEYSTFCPDGELSASPRRCAAASSPSRKLERLRCDPRCRPRAVPGSVRATRSPTVVEARVRRAQLHLPLQVARGGRAHGGPSGPDRLPGAPGAVRGIAVAAARRERNDRRRRASARARSARSAGRRAPARPARRRAAVPGPSFQSAAGLDVAAHTRAVGTRRERGHLRPAAARATARPRPGARRRTRRRGCRSPPARGRRGRASTAYASGCGGVHYATVALSGTIR